MFPAAGPPGNGVRMDLIIVESPSKAKTISKYLKGKYRVDASAGHVRDLPEKRLGVDVKNNFEPTYVINADKKAVISRLQEEVAKADRVYLATDPDREGEAISWHLKTVLKLPDGKNRIEFNEISPAAVTKALENPREINYNLVNAQQARRVLDRLVGYKLSPYLCNSIQSGLSAGRVQSVALRMIVDREREIQAFKPDEYWEIYADLRAAAGKSPSFRAKLATRKGRACRIKNAEECKKIETALGENPYVVSSLKKSKAKSHAPAPFTTSTLQQDASSKFSMTAPDVMLVAQHLYEGMNVEKEGHIAFVTYIRTDSVRVSAEAQAAARSYIAGKYGEEFLPVKPNFYKNKSNAQDAHECIRPIDLQRTPESVKDLLDRKHYNVYKLIYDRFLASQMSEAVYDSTQIKIQNGEYGFKASGRVMRFPGFTVLYQDFRKPDAEDGESASRLPDLTEGETLNLAKLSSEQKFTKPPLRFTDASLVKAMEDKGIGRPSTYASIISVLTKRKYVTKEKKYMVPTDVAYRITDLLVEHFADIMDVGFTARMEDRLDGIEEGGDWHEVIAEFYPDFSRQLTEAYNAGTEMTDIPCEKCGHPMLRKTGRYGKYLACSNYPACSNIKSDGEEEISGVVCPKCGVNMIVKAGRYGKFLSCPNYPDCSAILPYDARASEEKCPECGEFLFLCRGKYGEYFSCLKCGKKYPKTELAGVCPVCGKPTKIVKGKGKKPFYSCTGYPACKFISWNLPTGGICPECGKHLVQKGNVVCCSSCSYKESAKETEKSGK